MANLEKGTYAKFKTTMGDITCRLFKDIAPKTVENFIGLATGTKEYVDIKTKEKKTGKFYDGLIFHRVIKDFMIQGGCPLGLGFGGPGYSFADEFHKDLRHDKPGILSMANSGPNTNGSQFFITHVATPWLDDRHSVFGEVVENIELVQKIGKVKVDSDDRPMVDIVINELEIFEV